MTEQQFWHGDPWLAKYYRKAHDLKRQERNQELWMQGLYIYDALAVVLGNAFGKKGGKKLKYLEKPIDITEKTEEEKEREEIRKQNQIIANLNNLKINWDTKQKRLADQN